MAYIAELDQPALPIRLPDAIAAACRTARAGGQAHYSYRSTGWLFGFFGITSYNHVLGPNSDTPDCSSEGVHVLGAYSARSLHPGGVFVLFADGSVDSVGSSIDLTVWRSLSSYDGGESQ